ncbi:copper homeostasis protein CutC [Streptomyces sp. NPDC005438]|uniref:copper homeostasis protein CutC n=1 Tax=Streptomyces sp. NPDC005438 TaxID=3156880 RepID=UPI0033B96AB2
MSRPLLEVIALSAPDAVAAERGGADRLELVAEMAADGLTPTLATFAEVRDAVDLPLRVMLRSQSGFGTGGRALEALCELAGKLRAEGAEEFVLGFLDEDGRADLAAVDALLDQVPGCPWTFHRAVDHAMDRAALREAVAGTRGPDTFLTAGSPSGVAEGLPVLAREAASTTRGEPGFQARVLVGGGLRLEQVPELRTLGLDAFHIGSAARLAGWDTPVDEDAVRRWRGALDEDPAVPEVV